LWRPYLTLRKVPASPLERLDHPSELIKALATATATAGPSDGDGEGALALAVAVAVRPS